MQSTPIQRPTSQPSSSATPQGRQGAPAALSGSFCSRPVVVGTVPFDERLRNHRISQVATGAGMLVGAAVAYWQDWGSEGVNAVEPHTGTDTRSPDGATAAQVLGPMAGAVAGWATKRLVIGIGNAAAYGYDWFQAKLGKATPQQQLNQVVAQAVEAGPLTLEGTRHALARIKTLQDTFKMPPGEILRAIAKLGAAIPTEAGVCVPRSAKPAEHLGLLLNASYRAGGTVGERNDALVLLGSGLKPGPGTTDEVREDLARVLGATYAFRTAPADAKAGIPLDILEDRAKFLQAMRTTAMFGQSTSLGTMETELACSVKNYDSTRPQPVRHQHVINASLAGDKELKPLFEQWLKSVNTLPDDDARAAALDGVMAMICGADRGGMDPQVFSSLNRYLSDNAGAPAPLGDAAKRAKFLVNHWRGGRETAESKGHGASPMRELALKMDAGAGDAWKSAPCSLLEHLAYLASQSPGDATLQALMREACGNDRITDRLAEAPLDALRKEATAALGVVHHGRESASERAEAYVAIFETLAARDDLPPGMFITGLLPVETVQNLQAELETEVPAPETAGAAQARKHLDELSGKLGALSQMRGEVVSAPAAQERRTASFQAWLQSVRSPDAAITAQDFIAVPVKDAKH